MNEYAPVSKSMRSGEPESGGFPDPYTPEDEWLDQLASFPSQEQLEKLLGLMRAPELREYTQGLTVDTIAACKAGDLLEVAKVINGWIATAEELVTHRRKLRFIQAARSRQ